MLCAKFGWNWPSGSEEEDEHVKSLQTDRQTDGRMDGQTAADDRWSEKLTWAFSSGELKSVHCFSIVENDDGFHLIIVCPFFRHFVIEIGYAKWKHHVYSRRGWSLRLLWDVTADNSSIIGAITINIIFYNIHDSCLSNVSLSIFLKLFISLPIFLNKEDINKNYL